MEWFAQITEYTILAIDALALIVIAAGTVEAFIRGLRMMLSTHASHERRSIWLRYAGWLVAGLTFQLAADIIETSIAADWEAVGRLAAIAVIRTFLNYFLERDLAEMRDQDAAEADRSRTENEPKPV